VSLSLSERVTKREKSIHVKKKMKEVVVGNDFLKVYGVGWLVVCTFILCLFTMLFSELFRRFDK
jgi:hypothetical protein